MVPRSDHVSITLYRAIVRELKSLAYAQSIHRFRVRSMSPISVSHAPAADTIQPLVGPDDYPPRYFRIRRPLNYLNWGQGRMQTPREVEAAEFRWLHAFSMSERERNTLVARLKEAMMMTSGELEEKRETPDTLEAEALERLPQSRERIPISVVLSFIKEKFRKGLETMSSSSHVQHTTLQRKSNKMDGLDVAFVLVRFLADQRQIAENTSVTITQTVDGCDAVLVEATSKLISSSEDETTTDESDDDDSDEQEINDVISSYTIHVDANDVDATDEEKKLKKMLIHQIIRPREKKKRATFLYRIHVENCHATDTFKLKGRHWVISPMMGQKQNSRNPHDVPKEQFDTAHPSSEDGAASESDHHKRIIVHRGAHGVVGLTPTLHPGEAFEYYSGTEVPFHKGQMEGCFHMVTVNSDRNNNSANVVTVNPEQGSESDGDDEAQPVKIVKVEIEDQDGDFSAKNHKVDDSPDVDDDNSSVDQTKNVVQQSNFDAWCLAFPLTTK